MRVTMADEDCECCLRVGIKGPDLDGTIVAARRQQLAFNGVPLDAVDVSRVSTALAHDETEVLDFGTRVAAVAAFAVLGEDADAVVSRGGGNEPGNR